MRSAAVKPVVVGIDGSEQAAHTARWAVEKAVGRDVPLRLLYVVRTDLRGPLSAAEYRAAVDDAKSALHAVRTAIEAGGGPAVVETEIAEGSPAGVLLAESPDAAMICLGASGLGRLGRAMLGSTAAAVAERASCSVAIVRSPGGAGPVAGQTKWVMVPVSVFTENDDVMGVAVDQARLLQRPILAVGVWHPDLGATPYEALDNMVAEWHDRYPDVHIHPVATDTGMTQFLHAHPEMAGLVVIDAESAGDVASIVGGGHHSQSDEVERAVLVARNYADWRPAPSMR